LGDVGNNDSPIHEESPKGPSYRVKRDIDQDPDPKKSVTSDLLIFKVLKNRLYQKRIIKSLI